MFPLCGVIGPDAQRTLASSQCFPCVRGLSVRIMWSGIMLKVFPLCAGVIGGGRTCREWWPCVSPVRGGYRFLFGFAIISTLCFPCVGVIGLSAIRRFIAVSVSPAYRGYLGHVAFYGKNGIELPLCGVIGAPVPDRLSQERISPAWGLSGMDVLRNYSVTVFPLHGGLLAYSRGRYYPAHVFFPCARGLTMLWAKEYAINSIPLLGVNGP